MIRDDLKFQSVDQLWSLYEEIGAVLASKMTAEKAQLERRLHKINAQARLNGHAGKPERARRPYPQVFPKFKNPAQPFETWSGRGKQPRWLTAKLGSGMKLEDFRIQPSSQRTARSTR
jgi:DNA-binding protein H-NS